MALRTSNPSESKIHPAPGEPWPELQELDTMFEARPDFTHAGGIEKLAERLGTDLDRGLPVDVDEKSRIKWFGLNAFAEKELTSYCQYIYQALHDKLLIMLIIMATLELVIKLPAAKPEKRNEVLIDPLVIFGTVFLIVNVQSCLDYSRERKFAALQTMVDQSNLRFIVRGGEKMSVTDDRIVVGDIVSFNAHNASVIPADCILVSGFGVKTDESALTGEPDPVVKSLEEDPFMVSGTTVNAGSGKMLVVCVGANSVSGKIREQVYHADEDEESPLFTKLDKMAGYIGMIGVAVAGICFVASCVKGFCFEPRDAPEKVLDHIIISLGILAVAIPEGLPLALTISLAFSMGKMAVEKNLVKTLSSCETMGSATTICTDKTGTLTANRMDVRACYLGGKSFPPSDDHAVTCGSRVKSDGEIDPKLMELMSNLVSVCTMDESQVKPPSGYEPTGEVSVNWTFMGNPTECALLKFASDCGYDYKRIRSGTNGRSESSQKQGTCNTLTSARKMMSWTVPKPGGGCIIYVKGASEIILSRVVSQVGTNCEVKSITEADKDRIAKTVIGAYADQAMRTIGLAYREMDQDPGVETDDTVLNADDTAALVCETQLTLVGITGIEDPLRPEVPPAIQKCYAAGIDVRMVTGDNLNTAIAIAKGCGILRDEHFHASGAIKQYRAITGQDFREHVFLNDGKGGSLFQQSKFDEIWPYLRVMARSSPDDKLALAKGLQSSRIFEQTARLSELAEEGVHIFGDGQVVAMTGDGTNDAPALKAATVGFAMGQAGTQIAKDAANIILLDDNFASIVTAAKWGRNVYDCIQKFLQFQLTVNCAILVISLVVTIGPGSKEKPHPLPVTQMLWLNLIMDSLAALALASEPPNDEQLKRPPVNRSASIITLQMVWNMLGQATYQIIVVCVLFFNDTSFPDSEDEEPGKKGYGTYHYTIIFNSFVLMQLFNQYNSRFLKGEWNIFVGLHKNRLFLLTSASTFTLQILMAHCMGPVMKVHPYPGLTNPQWGLCIALGVGPLFWQLLINICTRSLAFTQKRWDVKGLSEMLKMGGPRKGDYRTHMGAVDNFRRGSNQKTLDPSRTSSRRSQC